MGNFLNVQAQRISWINCCTTHSKILYNYSERIKKDFYETDTEGFPEDIIKRKKAKYERAYLECQILHEN